MLQWISQSGSASPNRGRRVFRSSFAGLGIRTSLLLGFGAMSAVMILATSVALFGTAKISESINVILDERLPATVETLRVTRATDALAASGVPLASVTTDAGRRIAFQRVDDALISLRQSLGSLADTTSGTDDVRRLAGELADNLRRLRDMVDQRIDLVRKRETGRERLLSNLQVFHQHLIYRVRILEGDNDVTGRLLARPSPPMDRVIELVRRSVQFTPVAHFYGEVETISAHVMAATQDPTLTALELSRQILETELSETRVTFGKLPPSVKSDIADTFAELQDLILAENGLVALRGRELALLSESQGLIDENQRIIGLVDAATSKLVRGGLGVMAQAGVSANKTRQRYSLILIVVTGLGLLGIAALMYFHVVRHLIARLSWLSEAMQDVAAGRLDTRLPPAGDDELGRLGFAVHQFQRTTIEANWRESQLRIGNQELEKARVELEKKARELEAANSKLADLSASDFLTGLANRRHFDNVLSTEWARARRSRQPLALMMIDVDYFKRFNDRYGHQAGDDCLKQVAAALKKNVGRASDLVARYGGEEFAIVSPDTILPGARTLAEKIRWSIEALGLANEDTPLGIVTVSIGIAAFIPGGARSAADLVSAADTALYEAKASGRNCVKHFDELTTRDTVPDAFQYTTL